MTQTPMAQPLRAMLGLMSALTKLKLAPTMSAALEKPHAERLAVTIPAFARRKPNPAIRGEDVMVEGRGGPIHSRVYTRPDTKPDAPGYLFIHGGGFAAGGVEHCDHVCRELADRTGWVIVGLSYRLAPEYPFPAGFEDCQDVLTWMVDQRPAGMDPERLAVGGESAGGNLTAALALWSRDTQGPKIAHQSVLYPFADSTLSLVDWTNTKGNPGVGRAEGETMVEIYGGEKNRDNPYFSILHADLTDLPPTLVVTCGHDALGNEGIAFAKAVAAAGNDSKHTHLADMPHGYLLMTRMTKRAYETMEEMIAGARKHF